MLRLIQVGAFEFRAEQWENVSNDAKDLVRIIYLHVLLFSLSDSKSIDD
jgi:hypothetical protein